MCGNGRTYSRQWMNQDGEASIATECKCERCGDLWVTAGEWRLINGDTFVKVSAKDNVPVKKRDMLFGSWLTYNDARAKAYCKNRYAQGEGLNGHATTRFKTFADDAPYFRTDQTRLSVLVA